MEDNSNLRSRKISRMGSTPKALLMINAITIGVIFIVLLIVLLTVKYPPNTDNTLLQYLFMQISG